MFRTTVPHAARLSALSVLILAASVALAAPASAHVEVRASGASALAENVTIDFTAETESDKAGITKLEVILPEGIAPADVTYKSGPKGWKFAATDRGYTVGGPAVAVGEDAAYAVTVRQLPDAESLAFKTLQTYSDARVDRWIELGEHAEGGHGNSAPVLELGPAEPGAKLASPSPTAEPTSAAPSTPEADEPAESAASKDVATTSEEGSSSNTILIVALVAVAVALAGGGLWWFKRRGPSTS
ncbi:DUF1775 domain-containing protein [Streptomyces niveus]|uniref:YncI copper-binding domain-containing protein n=1 Tax=Streptomyces niveus TaxID=193462 RepID=A0A1U9QLP6_STRNV|nr:DUF1775 domain-containing protein [Streptomyces niveus]AQU64959.1 hypothetical protein BBN63_00425 [Streptomyces niveus]